MGNRKDIIKDKKYQFRYEYKYICTVSQMVILEHRIASILPLDSNVGEKGYYTISSLYFDDYSNRNYYENQNGTDPREKFRIRIYNNQLDQMKLELKRKERGKTQKFSCPLTKMQYHALMSKELEISQDNPDLLNKLLMQQKISRLEPKVIVEYDRVPYIRREGNVRITFDKHMSSSDSVEYFGEDSMPRRSIMPTGMHLLEVKFDEFLPDYIYRVLQMNDLDRTAYSKYYLSRRYTV